MPAWTEPHDWATDEQVTTALMNQVRDQLNHLFSEASLTAFDYPHTLDARLTSGLASVQTANWCHYLRIYHGGSISSLRIQVGVSNGTIGLATYSQSGTGISAMASTRTATSGSVACPASGIADVSIGATVTVGHGTHWFALSASGTTATFGTAVTTMVPTGLAAGLVGVQATAHPPPATTTAPTAGAIPFVIIGV